MDCSGEEAKTEESARGDSRPAGRVGEQRGQTARQPRQRAQGRPGQKPQKKHRHPPQRAVSASGPQKIIEIMITAICARFGNGAIGLGESGIRFTGSSSADCAQ